MAATAVMANDASVSRQSPFTAAGQVSWKNRASRWRRPARAP